MSNNISRSRSRKFLYQILYASVFSKVDYEAFKQSFFSGIFNSEIDEDYLKKMFNSIVENEQFLIEIVRTYAPKFEVEKMGLSCVLPIFIGSAEILLFPGEIPIKVSINEAVEISKIYGDDSSKRIVNGVLNSVYNDLEDLSMKLKNFKKDMNSNTFFKV